MNRIQIKMTYAPYHTTETKSHFNTKAKEYRILKHSKIYATAKDDKLPKI